MRAVKTALTVVLTDGQTVSAAAAVGGYTALGLVIPSTLTGTTLTFQVSADGTTYQLLYDASNSAVTIATVGASRSYVLPASLSAWPFLKIVSGTTQATADCDFILVGSR